MDDIIYILLAIICLHSQSGGWYCCDKEFAPIEGDKEFAPIEGANSML